MLYWTPLVDTLQINADMNVEALEWGAPGAPGPGSEVIKPILATIRERTPGCQDVGG